MITVKCGKCGKSGQSVQDARKLKPCIMCGAQDWRDKFGNCVSATEKPTDSKKEVVVSGGRQCGKTAKQTKKPKLKMTMLSIMLAGLFGFSEASALATCRYGTICPPRHTTSNHGHSHHDHTTRNIAIVAVGVAVVALAVGLHASANNPGQVRLAQF